MVGKLRLLGVVSATKVVILNTLLTPPPVTVVLVVVLTDAEDASLTCKYCPADTLTAPVVYAKPLLVLPEPFPAVVETATAPLPLALKDTAASIPDIYATE
tara:strand:- start:141 stop:443 length:303 start_codon:yes stop_codon:yes gene_type:complete